MGRRGEARQLVSHKSITVNGNVINIPSYQVETDIICVREKSRNQLRIQGALALAANRASVPWLEVNADKMQGVFKSYPEREDLSQEINGKTRS